MRHTSRLLGLTAVVLAWVATGAASAAVIDTLDDASNFAGWAVSGAPSTAVANGDGTVTLSRNVSGQDAGVDWRISNRVALTTDNNQLEVVPVGEGSVTPGFSYYSIAILYFDVSDGYVNEYAWISDSNSTATQVLSDVAAYAGAGAQSYFVRFRIQPYSYGSVNPAFVFTEIRAIPEPASLLLGALALPLMWRRRR